MAVTPLYVRSLFQLLHHLHVPQKAVVAHLGSSKPRVSQWAAGIMPLPRRYRPRFRAFVEDALEDALTASRAQTALARSEEGLATVQPAFTLAETIDTALTAWEVECYETLGHLQRDHTRACATLIEVAYDIQKRNPSDIHGETWRTFDQAITDLRRVRRLAHLRMVDPTQADTWGVSPEFGAADPIKRLRQIWQWATGDEPEDEPEDEHDA